MGVFDAIFTALVAENGPPDRLMIDATDLKAHRNACSPLKGGCSPRYRADQGRAELEIARGLRRRWPRCTAFADQGPTIPPQRRGDIVTRFASSDRDVWRQRLRQRRLSRSTNRRGITPCIPLRAKRKHPATYCKTLYKQRHKVENMFAKLKDWRFAIRFDRCAHMFMPAICIAATVIFWINQ